MLRWREGRGEGDGFANPASTHKGGRAAAAAVEVARDQVAALLPNGGRVFFTSGATEALNWALLRGAEAMPGGVAGLSIEHAASLQCLERLNERSEEHTSELQSLMLISYDVFCLKKKTTKMKTKDI